MTRETVVYVHGLWSSKADSLLLRRRLSREFHFDVRTFDYPTISRSMAEITARLAQFIEALRPRSLHLIGHSLGGLVIYRFLERFPDQPPGRVVFLGTPALGCHAAVGVARLRWGAAILGKCVAEELLVERDRRWTSPRALGIIAGTQPLGLGQLFARLPGDSDGTIAVSETRLPGATDHITVRASHMGLLLSLRTARETGRFLRDGYFALSRPPSTSFSSARSS